MRLGGYRETFIKGNNRRRDWVYKKMGQKGVDLTLSTLDGTRVHKSSQADVACLLPPVLSPSVL